MKNRKMIMNVGCVGLALLVLVNNASLIAAEDSQAAGKKIPVILDTDIGDDIDDTWALGMLLKCPELDLKLVVSDYGKAQYRAKLLAKFLQVAGRTDVAVGVGLDIDPRGEAGQAAWVKDYDLKSYPGKVCSVSGRCRILPWRLNVSRGLLNVRILSVCTAASGWGMAATRLRRLNGM
jgi:hypothetical protein